MLLSVAGLFEEVSRGIKSSYRIQTRLRKADGEARFWNFWQLAVYMLSHHTIYMIYIFQQLNNLWLLSSKGFVIKKKNTFWQIYFNKMFVNYDTNRQGSCSLVKKERIYCKFSFNSLYNQKAGQQEDNQVLLQKKK